MEWLVANVVGEGHQQRRGNPLFKKQFLVDQLDRSLSEWDDWQLTFVGGTPTKWGAGIKKAASKF
ncbi:MAG TPA: hypothetical protein VIU12_09220 [Chryseolinea sp.]